MRRKAFFQFVSPSLVVMTLMMVLPLLTAIWLSFNYITYSNLTAPEFVGWRNYIDVLKDPDFWASMRFTLLFIFITVPTQLLLGFCIAMLIDQVTTKIRGLYIAAILIPFILTPVVGTVMFRTMFDRGGLYFFILDKIFDYDFILTTTTVRILIITHAIWYVTPFAMVTLFAGLQTLPRHNMEAARMDGANFFQRIRYVVLPHLSPLIVFILLISIMDAYRIFDSILVMSRNNPVFKVDTIMYYNFKVATAVQRLGKANAISIITVIGILVVLIPFLVITYKRQKDQ